MNIADVQSVVSAAIGSDNIGETVEGLQRFPINVRYPREVRDSVEKLRQLSVLTERGAQIRLGDVTAPLLSMFVVPAVYLLLRRRQLRRTDMPVSEPGRAALWNMKRAPAKSPPCFLI